MTVFSTKSGELEKLERNGLEYKIEVLKEFGRKIGKEIIMTGNYGASAKTIRDNLFPILSGYDNDKLLIDDEIDQDMLLESIKRDLMKELIDDTIEESKGLLRGATALKKHIKKVAGKKVTRWMTPDGFCAINGVKRHEEKRFFLKIEGETYTGQYKFYNDDEKNPEPKATSNSIVPNFIQSLDATLLRMTVNKCDFDMTVIHDSFGCHPNHIDSMLSETKKAFVEIIESDPIKELTGGSFNKIDKDFSLDELSGSEWFFS